MISQVVVAAAAVVASVGFLLFGMGTSYQPRDEGMETLGLILLIGGLIVMGLGIVWYKRNEDAQEAIIEAEIRRRSSS